VDDVGDTEESGAEVSEVEGGVADGEEDKEAENGRPTLPDEAESQQVVCFPALCLLVGTAARSTDSQPRFPQWALT